MRDVTAAKPLVMILLMIFPDSDAPARDQE